MSEKAKEKNKRLTIMVSSTVYGIEELLDQIYAILNQFGYLESYGYLERHGAGQKTRYTRTEDAS